jgi:uncharacterized protein
MKYSQFNSIVTFDGRHHLYNSFTQKFIVIDTTLKDMLEAAVVEGIDGLEEFHPDFYSYLKSEEYIITNDTDEVQKVKDLSKSVDENANSFLLTINPTMNCNFKCWYCYETHIKKSAVTPEMIDKIGVFMEKTAKRPGMQYFSLAFFGGEPLLYFKRDVVPMIVKMQQVCVENRIDYSIGFTTNGYLVDDHFINFFKSNNMIPSLQITLDGFKEEHDKVRFVNASKGSYDEIIANVKNLLLNEFPVRLRINYTSENLPNSYKIASEFHDIPKEILEKYLVMDLHRVWQDSKNDDIIVAVDKVLDEVKKESVPVEHMSLNNVKDSCYADKRNSAVINYNGDLFKCTARDFTTVKRAGYLSEEGDLVWENDYLERRMNAKFKNKPCLSCRLLPLCNGGCSQHAMEAVDNGVEYCVFSGDENQKLTIIKAKVEEIIEALELNEA